MDSDDERDGEQVLRDAAAGGGPGLDDALARALDAASTWVGATVSIVGVGQTPSGSPCILVHTTAPEDLPDAIHGVPVVAVLDDQPHALDDPAER